MIMSKAFVILTVKLDTSIFVGITLLFSVAHSKYDYYWRRKHKVNCGKMF
jgi:hypothetical protein